KRDVTLVRLELAGNEESASTDDDLLKLVDDGGLADAGVSRKEDEGLSAVAGHALERIDERSDLTPATVQTLGDQQSVRHVARCERERLDPAGRVPVGKAPPKVGLDSPGRLIAVLRVLGQELEDDRREHRGNPEHTLSGRHGLSRDVAV